VDWPGEAPTWKSMSEETYVPGARPVRRGDSWLTSPWVWVAALIAGILVGAAAYLIVR